MSGIAVPGMISTFLAERASVGFAAARDRALRPSLHWISSWILSEDRRRLRLGISKGFVDGLAEALAANGELAATFEHIGPHETYQFKGTAEGVLAAEGADRDAWERQRARFAETVLRFDRGIPATAEQLRSYISPPGAAVVLAVREVFLQTPGPGAGSRLAPGDRP
jgi:hypothetical protein